MTNRGPQTPLFQGPRPGLSAHPSGPIVTTVVALLAGLLGMGACSEDTTLAFGQIRLDADAGHSDASGPGDDAGAGDTASGDEPDLAAEPDLAVEPDLAIEDVTSAEDVVPGEDAILDDVIEDTPPDVTDVIEDSGRPDLVDDGGLDTSDGGDEPPPEPEMVRFVAFGDWGGAVDHIVQAADAMWAHCQLAGCDFVLGLGDNFYEAGVDGVDDWQWEAKFETPFADWDIPFYMTLGNHDYLGDEQAQVDYSLGDTLWTMPDRTYELIAGPVHFFATDSNQPSKAQATWLYEGLRSSESPWRIGFGHHVWRSNGAHGDSTGSRRVWQEWAFCDQLDLLLAGHDHDLQHLEPECGVDLVVSGAVERLRAVGTEDNTLFAASVLGFVWFEVTDERLRLEFHTLDGELLHAAERSRPSRTVACSADAYCEARCAADPDCVGLDCSQDDDCNPSCPNDLDCYNNCPCDFNFGICEPIADPSTVRCGCDPQCRGPGRPCQSDGHCDTWCPSGVDPDCS